MKTADKSESAYIKVGKIGSPYGVHGWLKIQSYTEFGGAILEYKPWFITNPPDNERHIIEIEGSRPHGKGFIAKFACFETPEAARQLTGKIIEVERSHLPALPTNEFYWSDLVGLTVINKNGTLLGKVVYLMATGSNDVLVVKGNTELAIPYLPGKVILSIDLIKQEIQVDWDWI